MSIRPSRNPNRLRTLLGGKPLPKTDSAAPPVVPRNVASRNDTQPERAILRSYFSTRSPQLRMFLFNRWIKRAEQAANLYWRKSMPYRPLLHEDDLKSLAAIGLLKSIDKFDPDKNNNFPGWVRFHVRCSIIDGLRTMQDFPRAVAKNRRELREILQQLTQALCHKPTIEDVREHLGEAAFQMVSDPLFFANVFNQPLRRQPGQSDEDLQNHVEYTLDTAHDFDSGEMRRDMEAIVMEALDGLDRSIIVQYYFYQMTVPDIAETLGISTTTVSEKKAEALLFLKKILMLKRGYTGTGDQENERVSPLATKRQREGWLSDSDIAALADIPWNYD